MNTLLKAYDKQIGTICKKYKEFKEHKISHICDKILLYSIIFNNRESEDEKIFKQEESIEILKFLV